MRLTDRLIRKYHHLKKKFGWPSFYTPTPDTPRGLKKAFRLTKNLRGDYYEFGLFEGYSFYRAIKLGQKYGSVNNYFGFDSFDGLPEIQSADAGWRFKKGQYRCSLEEVQANLASKNCLNNNVHLIKGFYQNSLTDSNNLARLPLGKAKVVLIDSDLYESAREVLAFIYPYLQVGTAVLFDDWNCFEASEDKGERRAWREFLLAHSDVESNFAGYFGWGGAIFIIRKIGV